MSSLRCAVIGVGYLGRFHAQKYKNIADVVLVGIADSNTNTCQQVAHELNVSGVSDYRELLDKVDCVSIATPTHSHFEIAETCLKRGVHVLLEKPITVTVAEANTLIAIAHQNHCKLQVGHLERFNPAYLAATEWIERPLFIEATRCAPFMPRGIDVSVVFDLMIHDIDLVQTIVKSPVVHIDALGSTVLSNQTDIANVRLHFANHCVANLHASRVSLKTERKTQLLQSKNMLLIDYHQKQFSVFKKGAKEQVPGVPNLEQHHTQLESQDALLQEIKSFIQAIQKDLPPQVTGEAGRDALATAQMIEELLTHHQQVFQKEHATL